MGIDFHFIQPNYDFRERMEIMRVAIHVADILRSLERDVFPVIGGLPISELNPPKILEVLKAIEDRSAIETACKP